MKLPKEIGQAELNFESKSGIVKLGLGENGARIFEIVSCKNGIDCFSRELRCGRMRIQRSVRQRLRDILRRKQANMIQSTAKAR